MPDGDGATLARALRAVVDPTTPLILVSADAAEVARLRHAEGPFDAVLAKPVDLRRLLETIGACLALEWHHGEDPPPARTIDARLAPFAGELKRLAEIGFVRPLRERLDALAAEEPGLADTVSQLRILLDGFRLPELIETLDDAAP